MGICFSPNEKNEYQNHIIESQRKGNIIEQIILEGKIPPLLKDKEEKINKQLEMCVCKIILFTKFGTGFLCKIPYPDEFSYLPVLITNKSIITKNELLDKIKITITFDNDRVERIINITSERKIYTSIEYDITIIEIFPKIDDIHQFLEIDDSNKNYENDNIYILQYINGIKCAKSYGKIIKNKDFNPLIISHNCSKNPGGAILLIDNLKVIGINIHSGIGILLRESIKELYFFLNKNEINNNNKINCIDCIYKIENEKEFYLLHDFNRDIYDFYEKFRNSYIEGKKKKKILEENVKIYIDSQLIKFNYKYKSTYNKIHVKFIFNKILDDLSFMFFECPNLESIDLSSFTCNHIMNMCGMFSGCFNLKSVNFKKINSINMNNIIDTSSDLKLLNLPFVNPINVAYMNQMFFGCSSLESIDLSSFNTINVKNMNGLFDGCLSLKSLNISSFNTSNVKDMGRMFSSCSSLKSIDLSKFNTKNASIMAEMFFDCRSLLSLDLTSFNTINVKDMNAMFLGCHSIKSINLSSFNTMNVINMNSMFCGCDSLESINLSSFKTRNVTDMTAMFFGCFSLKTLDLSSFETPNLSKIAAIFFGCHNLKSIDLSSFNLSNNIEKETTNLIQSKFPHFILDSYFSNEIWPNFTNIFFGCFLIENVKCKDKYILEMYKSAKKFSEFHKNMQYLKNNQ